MGFPAKTTPDIDNYACMPHIVTKDTCMKLPKKNWKCIWHNMLEIYIICVNKWTLEF